MLEQSSFRSPLKRLRRCFNFDIWQIDTSTMPRYRSLLIDLIRMLVLATKSFRKDQCTMKFFSLTFLSSLSIVPVVVIAFGISQAFGFNIKKEMYGLLRGQESVVDQVFVYAENLLTRTRGDLIAGIGFSGAVLRSDALTSQHRRHFQWRVGIFADIDLFNENLQTILLYY